MEWWQILLMCLGSLAVGAVATFFIVRHMFNKQLKENPPVNRNMIRAMFLQMGRKPSEKDITRVINEMMKYQ